MSVSTKHAVAEITIKVLEQAAFIFADEVEVIDTELQFGVKISFQGVRKGYLELWTVGDVATTIADNLLGEVNTLDEKQLFERQIDALKEILSMIAGDLITEFWAEAAFNVDLPTQVDGALLPEKIPEYAVKLSTEEFPIVMIVQIEGNNN